MDNHPHDDRREAGERNPRYAPTGYYSILQIIGAFAATVITFPLGLVIFPYMFLKKRRGEAEDQPALETWTVVVFGIFGIIGVELGGERTTKAVWVVVGLPLLIILIFEMVI